MENATNETYRRIIIELRAKNKKLKSENASLKIQVEVRDKRLLTIKEALDKISKLCDK